VAWRQVSYGVRFEGGALVQLNGLPAAAFDALRERVAVLMSPDDAAVLPPGYVPHSAWRCSTPGTGC
jgi:hypothetical protein